MLAMRRATLVALVAVLACVGMAAAAAGQAAKSKKGDKEEELPKPEDVVLRTGDRVELGLTYYAGSKGKETIPIVLLHGLKQSRSEYKELAPALQALGYAVVVPDLRGHGQSTRKRMGGRSETLDAAKLMPSQFGAMVREDMTAVKDFLWERNNAGQLNLDKLCVVGADMGASVALNFAAYDATGYGSGAVYYGPLKLGRFVKALVLISPRWSSPGLPLGQAARNPAVQRDIAMLILVGKEEPRELSEAKRVYGLFKSSHVEPIDEKDAEKVDRQTLFFGGLPTSLQGTKLLDPKFNVQALIADFVYRRLIKSDESRDWTWKERKFPHE
ncbi:MAG: alpha/beta hydrolase [Planctomycetaceae bacterium]|nr:alpha/beta hydrolase [Planctomycetaceae bacterium]